MPLNKSQKVILGGIAFTLAALSVTTIYIPTQILEKPSDDIDKRAKGSQKGSMWKHMDERIKANSNQHNIMNDSRGSDSGIGQ